MALTSLDFSYCSQVTNVGLAELRKMPLEVLYLEACHRVTDEGVRSLVEGKQLKTLNLVGCWGLTEGILPDLASLPLVKLSLSQKTFSDAGLEVLRRAVPTIKELYLRSGFY